MAGRKFRQCYLHIGATKTGTSSIQYACGHGAALLAEHGYFYPPSDDNTHAVLASRFRHQPEKMWMFKSIGMRDPAAVEAHIASRMAAFEKALEETDAHTLVLSSEYFPSTPADQCVALRDYLLGWADKVTVIYYVRHPVAQYSSSLQQGIKQGMETLDDRRSYRFYAAGVSRKFQAAFGRENMCVREYSRATLFNRDSVADFFQLIDLDAAVAQSAEGVSVNEGLSHEGVLLADAFNRNFPMYKGEELNPARSGLVSFLGIPGNKFHDSPASLQAVAERCADDIAYMRAEYGLELAPPAPAHGQGEPEWSPATLDALVTKINDLGLRAQRAEKQLKRLREGAGAPRDAISAPDPASAREKTRTAVTAAVSAVGITGLVSWLAPSSLPVSLVIFVGCFAVVAAADWLTSRIR